VCGARHEPRPEGSSARTPFTLAARHCKTGRVRARRKGGTLPRRARHDRSSRREPTPRRPCTAADGTPRDNDGSARTCIGLVVITARACLDGKPPGKTTVSGPDQVCSRCVISESRALPRLSPVTVYRVLLTNFQLRLVQRLTRDRVIPKTSTFK